MNDSLEKNAKPEDKRKDAEASDKRKKKSATDDEGSNRRGMEILFDVKVQKGSDAAVIGTLMVSRSGKESRKMGIKRRKIENKQLRSASDANHSHRGIQRGIAEGKRLIREDQKAQCSKRREARDIELRKLLDSSPLELKEIIASVLGRSKNASKEE